MIIDKPRGFGVKFKSLKGWNIDAVASKKEGGINGKPIEAMINFFLALDFVLQTSIIFFKCAGARSNK